jgi:hypothetical protein
MKIRSLLLGSVAAAGLSTGAFAADLGVLTSLDVCDALGLSGLTISSDTNCLQITGGVTYEFIWGDYQGNTAVNGVYPLQGLAANTIIAEVNTPSGYDSYAIATPGNYNGDTTLNLDWSSRVEGWIKFVATADSDFGPAKAVIRLRQRHYRHTINESFGIDGAAPTGQYDTYVHGDDTGYVQMNEAYVSIGDSTVIMAGRKGTLMNFGDDVPLNFLGLFASEKVDVGVKWRKDRITDGGHVIQITSDLGNGVSVAAGLEDLSAGPASTATSNNNSAGTAFGVIAYAGDGISAHLTVAADGILDGTVNAWGYHAGVSGSFDMFKFVAAVSGDDTGYYNALASASATFDMFTIAVAGEALRDVTNGVTDTGAGGSISAAVTDGVTINLGGRWYRDAFDAAGLVTDSYQVAAQVVAAVTESITLTGEVGVYGSNSTVAAPVGLNGNVFYGAGQVAWAPGGNFTSSLKGEVYSNGAYKATFKAAKTFE